jgi:osmotically-inducible protein OsmY
MKSDEQIRQDVESELRWNPELDSTDIAVKVNDGVVTLSGFARNYFEKSLAEAAAKRVDGVNAVADDIVVRLPASHGCTDPELARAAVSAVRNALPQVWQNIQANVQDRHVTLEGVVEWNFQRVKAEDAVLRIPGIAALTNHIRIVTSVEPAAIKEQIEQAFRRNAELDAGRVFVDARGAEVTLKGEVGSWAEYGAAEDAAWAAPGVHSVRNELTVRH